jgi:hypothetical protein
MGGPGMQAEKKILRQFDKDSNGYLDAIERNAARESLAKDISSRPGGGPGGMGRPGGRGPGGPGGPGGQVANAGKPGAKVKPSDVTPSKEADLFAPESLRTLF